MHFQDSLSLDCCVSRALLRFFFIGFLHQYLAHFKDSLSLDYYLCISSTFRILFHWIVAFVFRALLGFFFIGFLHQYLAHFKDSLSLDYYLCISSTFRILFRWIVTFVSRALLGFSFIGLLRQYPAHFWDALSLDCCVCISRTFRIPYHQIITLVYHINCGVLQEFPALRKAVTTHVKKYRIQCQWPISYLHGTRLWRHSVRLMNERQSLYDSQYKLFVGVFSNHGG